MTKIPPDRAATGAVADNQRRGGTAGRSPTTGPAGEQDEMLTGQETDLDCTVPADQDQVTDLRRRLHRWLDQFGLPSQLREDIVLATYEALTNAAEHAYQGLRRPGPVTLTVRLDQDAVTVTVADQGCWRPPPTDTGFRGFGLSIIRSLADQVAVDRGAGGTVVTARYPRPRA